MSGYFFNFFEVSFTDNQTEVFVLPYSDKYRDKEAFNELKINNPDFWFHRVDNEIFLWNYKNNGSTLNLPGLKEKKITLLKYPFVFSKMVELGVEQFLLSKGYEKFKSKFGLNSFINKNNNLTKYIDGLATYLTLIFRTFYSKFNSAIKVGLVLDFKLTHDFIWNKDDFITNHVDISGLLTRDDKSVIANFGAIKRLVEASGKSESFEKIIRENISSKNIFKKIDATYTFFNNHCVNIYLNEDIKLDKILKLNLPYDGEFFKKDLFLTPNYYYDRQLNLKGRPSDILKKCKPFTFQQFKNKEVNILLLASKKNQGHVEIFIKKLSNNLKEVFHLGKVLINDIYFDESSILIDSYKKVIYENVNHQKHYDLVLTVIEDRYKKLLNNENPYYFSKAKLIGQGIPTQEITIEKIRSINEYILNNVALAIYAKIGGTAWTIEKIEPLRHEIIIGIGSSIIRSNTSKDKRVVGFATIFDYSGKYIIGDCSPISSFEEYKDNLKNYLIETINKIIKCRNIAIGSELRIIFHLFKSAGKKREIFAIEEAIKNFPNYKIEFALLHVNYHHNFKIFKNEGKVLPERGLILNLSENQMLINFITKTYKGTPAPLRVILDNRSTFKDLSYLVKQVFFFSFMSFRSFTPSKKPITISYPSILSKLTEEMKAIEGWDYDKLQHLENRLWFL